MSCITCEILDKLSFSFNSVSLHVMNLFSSEIKAIFKCFVNIWLVWQIIFKWVLQGKFVYHDFVKKIVLFCFILVILEKNYLLNDWLFEPLEKMFNSMLTKIACLCYRNDIHDYKSVLEILDSLGQEIYQLCSLIWDNSSIFNFATFFAAICLIVPFTCLWSLFLVFVVEYFFFIFFVKSMYPLFALSAGFSFSRRYVLGAVNAFLQSIINFIFSFIVMCVSLKISMGFFQSLPSSSEQVSPGISEWVFGKDFIACIISCVMAIIFNLRIRGISSTITGSSMRKTGGLND